MSASVSGSAIPKEIALQLCEQIREANRGKWYTFNGLWCWGCARFSADAAQRCFSGSPQNRGCTQVNARYDRLIARATQP